MVSVLCYRVTVECMEYPGGIYRHQHKAMLYAIDTSILYVRSTDSTEHIYVYRVVYQVSNKKLTMTSCVCNAVQYR